MSLQHESNSLSPLVKKKRRKLTPFMAREMLYDFITEGLDEERRQAMVEFLPTSPEIQTEVEKLRAGILLCQDFQKIQPDRSLIDQILATRTPWERFVKALSPQNWPEFVKWGAEALAVSAVVTVLAVFIPWNQVTRMLPKRSTDITLTEVKKQEPTARPEASGPDMTPPTKAPSIVEETKVAATVPPAITKPVEVAKKPPVETQNAADTKAQLAKVEAAEEGMSQDQQKGPAKGELFRAFMTFEDTEEVAEEIRNAILELGGLKAGQVDLGWSKPGGKYYHFTLPKKNFEALQEKLKVLGPVRISKESHPRVMPEDQIRIILWVEGQSLKQ